jgi:hypothetical protein
MKKKIRLTESELKTVIKKIITESGIRDITKFLGSDSDDEMGNIHERYKKAKIYFHQDLDGVTTAIAMKKYLENQGFEVVDCEVIQYGEKEWAIKKPDAKGEVMPVLVDFAHGKPMFKIHTDHHDSQAGVEKGTSTSFKHSRSNVETISQTVSPKELFSDVDLFIISTVDSANYAMNNITPKMVMNFIFSFDENKTSRENMVMLGLVTNKLLLAYKNYPKFMEDLVMRSEPSIKGIYNLIKQFAIERNYADIDTMIKNQEKYIKDRKEGTATNAGVQVIGNILTQFDLGHMKKGSYDRYIPFELYPDADFLVTGMASVGMVQASCNPFKKERALKGIDLGKIKDEVLEFFKPELEQQILPYSLIKKISERSATEDSVGFTKRDMEAIYGEMPSYDGNSINGYDFLDANSGGHKCITNISGINFIYSNYAKPYTKDLPEELLPIANYKGDNDFVKDIKGKLLKYRKLSPKQVEAAMRQINKENEGSEDVKERTTRDLIMDMRNKFIEILQRKIDEEGGLDVD